MASGITALSLMLLLASVSFAKPAAADGIFVEAESFAEKGGWCLDQQFMDQMGSPYLLAHGMGEAVADATTTVPVATTGRYHVYVRTFNWTSPWTPEPGPGAFRVLVDGKPVGTVLGTHGDRWMWQYAGSVRLRKGSRSLALRDLSGFDGRCDAVWLTPDRKSVPPEDGAALEEFRRSVGALPAEPSDGGSYDLVVVGAGIGGI